VLDSGDVQFETSDGEAVQPLTPRAAHERLESSFGTIGATPRALSGGERYDYAYAVGVLADACADRSDDVTNRGP